MNNIEFSGHGTGFKPGMDPGPYDTRWLHGPNKDLNKLTEYDMSFAKMLLPDSDILQLFADATEAKRIFREVGEENRKTVNAAGEEEELEGD